MPAWLGKQVLPTDGSGSYKLAAMSRLRGGGAVRFNKYSGIQEWQNAVRDSGAVRAAPRAAKQTPRAALRTQVALFVNVRGKSGSYANIFMQGGRQMTWFAQPTQSEETPVIRRLLACRDLNAATPVLLFIREEGCAYVYAGRLTCHEYFPRASPLKLVWQLADFEVRRRGCDPPPPCGTLLTLPAQALQSATDYVELMKT